MRWWQDRGLRFKLILGINSVLLLLLGGSFLGISGYVRAQLWQREVRTAENWNAIVATLLEDAMMAGRKDQIQEAIEKLGRSAEGQIDSIAIYNDHAAVPAETQDGFDDRRTGTSETMLRIRSVEGAG